MSEEVTSSYNHCTHIERRGVGRGEGEGEGEEKRERED